MHEWYKSACLRALLLNKNRSWVSLGKSGYSDADRMLFLYTEDESMLSDIKKYLKNLHDKPVRHIFVLSDSDKIVQSVASVIFKQNKKQVKIEILLSAPWNFLRDRPIPKCWQPFQVRGAGKALMLGVYKYAQSLGAQKLKLFPLYFSESFYEYIGMKKVGLYREFDVTKEIPVKLQNIQLLDFKNTI